MTVDAGVPTMEDLLAGARTLAPVVEAEAQASDQAGSLSDEVGERMRDSGLTALWVPRDLGGSELPLDAGHTVVEELSRINGSFGWVGAAQVVAQAAAGAFLNDAAVGEIFRDGIPGIAGQGLPRGKAVACDGGYLVGTTWSYGSGIKQARWVLATSFVHNADGTARFLPSGAPDARICYVPREDVVLEDNWDVMGLCATGSVDYTGRDLFVSEDFGHPLDISTPVRGGSIYLIGIMSLATVVHTAWALGNARRMVDELAALVREGHGRFAQDAVSERFHERFAEADGNLRMARGFAYDTLRDAQRTLDQGDRLSTRQATMLRTMVARVTWTAADVVRWAYFAAGGTGLRSGVVQRCFRDMHAATQHGIVAPAVSVTCGRELLGLADGKVWLGRALVEPSLV